MMRRKWMVTACGAAAAAIALTLLLPERNSSRPEAEAPVPASPRQEHSSKKMMLSEDILATDKLIRLDARQHLQSLLQTWANQPVSKRKTDARQLLTSHHHIRMLMTYDTASGKAETYSSPDDGVNLNSGKFKANLSLAKDALRRHEGFESASMEDGGEKYFLVAEPASDRRGGVIALMSQQVLNAVEEHQRKNLRLIPYPREGKFKVESVHPDTFKDLTVKTGHDNENASHFYENEIVVRFRRDPSSAEMQKILADLKHARVRKLGYNYVFRSNDMSFRELRQYFNARWSPRYTEPHYLYLTNDVTKKQTKSGAPEIPNDLLFSKYQWNLPATETNRGWNLSKGSKDVIVAVVDTGVDLDHPDLKGQLLPGYNVIQPGAKPYDDVGHGTHVSGVISAIVNNGEGVAGMTWYNKVLPVKVLDSSGSGTTYSVAEGIIWAADHGAKVINLSLGNYADAQFLHDAVKYAFDRDVVLIAATGNDNTERPGYPAAYPEVFAVSATDSHMKRASFSNYGDYVDVMAPGASIASTFPGNQYAALSGTSMASPHVAALAGLIRSINPDLTNTEVMDLMRKSVIDLGTPGHDKYYGYGQIDVYKALNAAGTNSTPLQFWPNYIRSKLDSILRRHSTEE
ncbi:S8 family peptidase [Paenibacillus sp. JX-17]|uniref:S8 family peptidase n=1 Tax=Paenibacillus lacisoli TaxID=3064525 RepID=A0ABT9C9W8_9BACL|nr:S8 family peptidase [Paenibacillus sp. JX-17]MDO7905439.1 S8 family peptidase [Paenibacillus sp. JX-17]